MTVIIARNTLFCLGIEKAARDAAQMGSVELSRPSTMRLFLVRRCASGTDCSTLEDTGANLQLTDLAVGTGPLYYEECLVILAAPAQFDEPDALVDDMHIRVAEILESIGCLTAAH